MTHRLFFDKSGRECSGRRSRWASGRPIQVILYANTSVPMNCGRQNQVAALAGFTCILNGSRWDDWNIIVCIEDWNVVVYVEVFNITVIEDWNV